MVINYASLSPGKHLVQVRVHNSRGETSALGAEVFVNSFHGEMVSQASPNEWVIPGVQMTVDGVTRAYDLKLEWSNESQGFEISADVPHRLAEFPDRRIEVLGHMLSEFFVSDLAHCDSLEELRLTVLSYTRRVLRAPHRKPQELFLSRDSVSQLICGTVQMVRKARSIVIAPTQKTLLNPACIAARMA